MPSLSNQQALNQLKHHKQFSEFLRDLDYEQYPGLDLEKVFYFVSTGTVVKGMPLDSTLKLLQKIKSWLANHSHGGPRQGSGRPKSNKQFQRVTLSAEEKYLKRARKVAEKKGTSLQQMFRKWLVSIG